jgi:PmbA protein
VAYGAVEPQALVEKALALSQLNQPELIELGSNSKPAYPDLGQAVPVEQLVEWGKQALALIRDAYPEVIVSAEWDSEIETTRLVNSQGLDCFYTDTTLSCYLSAEWVRGDDLLSVSDGQTQRNSLHPEIIAQQVLQRLNWAKENVSPPSGRVPVLFTSKAADMLWGTVQAALNGKRVLEKASPWAERLGQPVMATALTLYQDPEAGPFSCPFDDEGTPTQPLVFIQNGVLQRFYGDRAVGRQMDTGTTGNGFRPGLGSYPTPGLFNLLIQPGNSSQSDLITQLRDGLIVDQMLGGGGSISGDFSINVDLGYRVKHGQVLGRVKDTMVAGNIYTALKQLVALGSDAEWNGSCYTPSVIVEGLSTTGRN